MNHVHVTIYTVLHSESLRIRLLQVLIFPHLDYFNTLYIDANITRKAQLQILSNTSLKYIYGVSRERHIFQYRKNLNWLCTEIRRLYFTGIIIHKVLRLREPFYLTDLFVNLYSNMYPGKMPEVNFEPKNLPFQASKLSKFFLLIARYKILNPLPFDIRFIFSLNSFKTALFK